MQRGHHPGHEQVEVHRVHERLQLRHVTAHGVREWEHSAWAAEEHRGVGGGDHSPACRRDPDYLPGRVREVDVELAVRLGDADVYGYLITFF